MKRAVFILLLAAVEILGCSGDTTEPQVLDTETADGVVAIRG